MLLSLFYAMLLLRLGLPPLAVPTAIPFEVYRQEADLLTIALDRTVLKSFPVWDDKTSALRPARPGEILDDSTPILVLHLWATWCGPCKEEFPTWKKLQPILHEQHRGRVNVFHIAMQNEPEDVVKLLKQLHGKMPFGALYFDRGGHLADNLRRAFDDKALPPLPMTLWLDPDRNVRRAIIGPISSRIPEVMSTSAKLLHLVEQQ